MCASDLRKNTPTQRPLRKILSFALAFTLTTGAFASDLQKLKAMSLEELANIEVSIVGKRPNKLSETAAAVFVITAEDIRRSTATRLPELLRMVPGLNVARLDASEWAISARGFNSRYANKLLVMIDGRSIYAPLFSGTLWEGQDVILEDIERIEVIRGPGAATWGANAVNGVINIITKSAADTQGSLATGLLGNEQRGAWLRHGFSGGDNSHYRAYAKYHHHEPFTEPDGDADDDEWSGHRAGFRADQEFASGNRLTVQGDIYHEDADDPTLYGGNLLGRWEYQQGDGPRNTFQLYYDRSTISSGNPGDEKLDTVDLEYHQEYDNLDGHILSYGLGYRWMYSEITPISTTTVLDPERTTQLFSAFAQDNISLVPEKLLLTLGVKLEKNDYSGFEVQPNLRLNWQALQNTTIWGAISRAVRTPSRGEHDMIIENEVGSFMGLPVVNRFGGDPNFDSEELIAYELGFRSQASSAISLDLALFYNKYDNLRTLEPETEEPVPDQLPIPTKLVTRTLLGNNMSGKTYGLELAVDWRLRDWWRLQLAYSYLKMQLELDPGSADPISESEEFRTPRQQLSLHSGFDIDAKTELDLWGYYADQNDESEIDSYFNLDIRLARRLNKDLSLELVGRNLLDPHHTELSPDPFTSSPQQVDREVFLKLTWRN